MKELFDKISLAMHRISAENLNQTKLFSSGLTEVANLELQALLQDKFVHHTLSSLDGSVSPRVADYFNLVETVLALRFDETNLYVRSNIEYQAGHPGPQFWETSVNALSNKKYLIEAYPWQNLVSTNQLFEFAKKHNLPSLIKNLSPSAIYQIHFFSLNTSNQRSWKYFLSGKNLTNLFSNKNDFLKFCKFEHFEWLAIREHKISTSPLQKQKTTISIFVDSLDRRIFENPLLAKILPNLFSLRDKGTLFRGFTSSASWTYPVLSSIYSGINSAIDLRLWRTPWPADLFLKASLPNLDKKDARLLLLREKLHQEYLNFKYHPFSLTRNISNSNIYGMKNSLNHSWRHGMSSYYTTSMEKSGFNTNAALNEMSPVFNSSNSDRLIFIDLDHAHRHTIPKINYPHRDASIDFDDLKFLNSMIMAENTITGSIHPDKVSIYLRRYQEIDNSIGAIVDYFGDSASYLLFSDHGSSFVDYITDEDLSNHHLSNQSTSSSVSLNKVATPTLLYVSANTQLQAQEQFSEELVSSQDIYDIIKFLTSKSSNYTSSVLTDNELLSSRLPCFFGGPGRATCLSSGYAYSGSKEAVSIELMARYNNSVTYKNIPLLNDVQDAFVSLTQCLNTL
ncbi:hypothetical protein PMIT1313_00571 [Prochlorococcus marinus str. MIT 1313]|uniref:sulfatase-like hydrolase/transferase n=1 Tax=Prochlorococcus TaxID=1218 RepID=UPI0007B3A908|nr:sulfatase-like hydrolase/transferase [Prochlorococcus marinus]KZR70261.1 hypothetical protein PMIT1313_00571 [Prochlorococcus marinus str. MIT 1313]KZR70733.1 hypothetical protein PMIT1318_01873 [Prochlorococcus marinus str. MIT 1318]